MKDTQQIPYDEVIEKYFPVIKDHPAVSPRDTAFHFTPQAVRYFAREGVLPYTFDNVRGEITFALDESRYEFMTPDDFRIQFHELFSSMSPQLLKNLTSENSQINFIHLPGDVIERLAPYVADPELITSYVKQRKLEADINRGFISDAEGNKFVDGVLGWAIKERASDVHFESMGGLERRIRVRIDGILRECPSDLDSDLYRKSVVILKNRCGAGIKIDEKRKPQDGQLTYVSSIVEGKGAAQVYDLRTAFRPVFGGDENVILRIAQRGTFKTLDQLGLSSYDHQRIKDTFVEPNGIILVTGPTGSGKTTTLYGMLHSINDPKIKIITMEDPVEVKIPGLQQTQVLREIGVDFPSFLRGALRSDPDVVFVGEIRDNETAQAAIEAAKTGHMVLSSLHTNNASGAVNRLIGMDVSKVELAENLRGVLAQTLVPIYKRDLLGRLLSGNPTLADLHFMGCAPEEKAMNKEKALADSVENALSRLQCISGGEALNQLIDENFYPAGSLPFYGGDERIFAGREALTEFWLLDEQSQDAICSPVASISLLTSAAEHSGMRPMFISGVEKVKAGKTSLEAVVDAVGKSVFKRKKEFLKNWITV